MSVDLKSLYTLYLKPKAMLIIVSAVFMCGLVALLVCHIVKHRYAATVLFKVAEFGGSSNTNAAVPFPPFGGKSQSSLGTEAISYLEFQYLARGRTPNGLRLVEAKELKSSGTIQLVAEGPNMDAIEAFLKNVLIDLQGKYQNSIDAVMGQGTQEVKFLRQEMASLERLKAKVEHGIDNVGPAPALVSQSLEINQSLVKLKQDYFLKSAMISSEKIHNFKLDTILAVGEGAPVYPKTKQSMLFSMFVGFLASVYGIFLFDFFQKKIRAKAVILTVPISPTPISSREDVFYSVQ
ncbi:MAG: hypothetical protein H7301_01030 [Cryobacterium sp.]|nr:hypothetical protein [Oligoflexia bacterium]